MPIQTPICDFGQKALPFELKSTDSKVISLNDIKGQNGTLIMFICNHCPYVVGSEERIEAIANKARGLDMGFVGINSNDPMISGSLGKSLTHVAMAPQSREVEHLEGKVVTKCLNLRGCRWARARASTRNFDHYSCSARRIDARSGINRCC